VQSDYKEDVSWESEVVLQSFKWSVSRELGSLREAEKMALWVQVWSVTQRTAAWLPKLKNPHCVESVARKRLVETNWPRTLVCVYQWTVKYSSEWCIQEVNKSNSTTPTPSIVTHPQIRDNKNGQI
jgi:hypothetical protein